MTLNNLNTTILEKFDKFKFKGWDEEEKVEVELSEFLSPDEVGQLKQFLLSAIKEAWESGRGEKRNKTKYKYTREELSRPLEFIISLVLMEKDYPTIYSHLQQLKIDLSIKADKPNNYAKEFENQLGNPIEQLNELIEQAKQLNYKNTSGKVGGVSGVALTTDNARPQGNSKPSDESVVYMCETILGYLDMGMVDRAKQHLENLQRWFIYLPTEGELLKVKQSK
jgi:flagellar hook-basal body complex protein FliE